jgi:hypothetical protein
MLSYGGLVADNDPSYLSSIGAINRMKREWTDLEFADWTLLPSEAALLANKRRRHETEFYARQCAGRLRRE